MWEKQAQAGPSVLSLFLLALTGERVEWGLWAAPQDGRPPELGGTWATQGSYLALSSPSGPSLLPGGQRPLRWHCAPVNFPRKQTAEGEAHCPHGIMGKTPAGFPPKAHCGCWPLLTVTSPRRSPIPSPVCWTTRLLSPTAHSEGRDSRPAPRLGSGAWPRAQVACLRLSPSPVGCHPPPTCHLWLGPN